MAICTPTPGLTLDLRLHNDDVHTFDEVIDTLSQDICVEICALPTTDGGQPSLVPLREDATE
jgi:hypothetical protein